MSSYTPSSQDKRDLDKFIKFLCLKSTQVIVQGRLGKAIITESVPSPTGAEWFNLAVKDYPEIQREAKAAISEGNPSVDKSLVVEISLRTSDADLLVLEVWSIGLTNKCEGVRVHHTVYNRMSLLLKSLLCVSRVTPAYKLSRNQGNDYVICYRVYTGQISLSGLGEGFNTLRVGSVGTPIGTVTMSAAYRTTENLHVSTKGLSPKASMPFEVKPDHFASRPHESSPARPCHTLQSRLRTLSETSDGRAPSTVENSPSYNVFNTSFSISPGGRYTEKDGSKVMFTVGTPPSGGYAAHRSVSSPVLARVQRKSPVQHSTSRCSPSCGNGFHTPRCAKLPASFIPQRHKDAGQAIPGSSAPTLQWYKQGSPSPDANKGGRISTPSVTYTRNRISGNDDNTDNFNPDEEFDSSTTTYCHWNNSNVSRVTADSVKCNPINTVSTKTNANTVTGWIDSPRSSPATSPLAIANSPPPPALVTGAFVTGSKTANRARETLAAAESSTMPFSDLLSAIEDGQDDNSFDDNLSQKSDSDTSPDVTSKSGAETDQRTTSSRLPRKGSSSSSLSSKQSNKSSNSNPKPRPDDFVMVDLKPAFGRDDSIGDLGTFYRECENIPELVMFQEQRGTETDETLLDLTKQLEDYENDMEEFDQFVSELNT